MLQNIIRRSFSTASRRMNALARQPASGKQLMANQVNTTGRRFMSGHGPDISRFQAAMYILIGGGSFAAFGTYQAISMRNRIEAFETGKVIPHRSLDDEQFQAFKEQREAEEEDDE